MGRVWFGQRHRLAVDQRLAIGEPLRHLDGDYQGEDRSRRRVPIPERLREAEFVGICFCQPEPVAQRDFIGGHHVLR